jgi:hypothetical protein
MSEKMFWRFCSLLVLFVMADAFCVYVHDLDHASDGVTEASFLKAGHFSMAWIEDAISITLIALAAVCYRRQAQTHWLSALALCFAGIILGVEFFSQLGILTTEDQRLLSSAGSVTRVFAVLLSALVSSCCTILGLYLTGGTTEPDSY